MGDLRDSLRNAYERQRAWASLPYAMSGLVLLGACWLLGSWAWPIAGLVGLLGAVGRWRGRDLGAGLALGAILGVGTGLVLLCYSVLGCCSDTCGSCTWVCGAVVSAAALLLGLGVRARWGSLLGAVAVAGLALLACWPALGATGWVVAAGAVAGLVGRGVRSYRR